MDIKVSVIVAIHNGGHHLTNTLDAIKNQTLKDIEVLMIDAASTDETAEIMKQYSSDKRFIYTYRESESISEARNSGIENARGKYVAFGDVNVIFTENLIEEMYNCAEKVKAQLCVAPMGSSDVYGKHEFTSSGLLSRRKRTSKFDTDLIWNPAVTNKLFLRSRILENNHKFRAFGKAREAAFTIPFAFENDVIACSAKGTASYVIPVHNEGVSEFPIEHYLEAYEFIISHAEKAFRKAIDESQSDFDRKELKKLMVCYIDQVYHKEATVLLYSYYRHFWCLSDEEIEKYAKIITELMSKLSKSGYSALKKKNKDIFYSDRLLTSKKEMAENPKATICIGKNEKNAHHAGRLKIQVQSIFSQTMPSFELLVDSRLSDIFPEEWKNKENVTFIECESLGEFKDIALQKARTDYIMFQDGFARLNPKILMRHYAVLEGKDKYGFTTSPLTRFDGKKTTEYSFSDLCFYSDINQTRVKEDDQAYALDLFFCNKLFRTEHLKGIRFNFTDNTILDMYKLYSHSRFRKLSHRGAYLPYTEEEAIQYLMTEKHLMPADCTMVYKRYKTLLFRKVKVKELKGKVIKLLKKVKRVGINYLSKWITSYYRRKPLQNRVFFYTIRANDMLLENINCVYGDFKGEKVVFAKMLPHSLKQIAEVRKYMLTSKVIVTDDYMKYLRAVRLRDGQKVIQLWHAGGAFKRFGLDAPSRLTRLEEFRTHSQYSDVCVTSEYVRQFYAHAFGIDMEVVKAIGSPRTDAILDAEQVNEKKNTICTKHPLLKNKRVYVYFPTFRESEGAPMTLDTKIDWAKLNEELSDDEVFVVSRHPVMKEEFFKGAFYSRVKDYTSDPTPELLAVADVVITDYSSIIFDASLMNKSMVFYCPDYGNYERDFYLDYDKDLPGEIVCDSESLLSALRRADEVSSREVIAKFREKEMGACDGHSTERVVNLIEEYLKN
ncbi:MAG: CDP-glycerol glycerophosphotransferase family protein [Clostridia bacterium]|nr:CDP-glycerol glycerophosphotransferase family protein [Clostridia bacterium]